MNEDNVSSSQDFVTYAPSGALVNADGSTGILYNVQVGEPIPVLATRIKDATDALLP